MSKQSIDISKYQTEELQEEIIDLLSVPQAVMLLIRTAALVFLALQGINALLNYFSENSLTTTLFTSFYMLIASLVIGLALGLLLIAKRILKHSDRMLNLMLGSSQKIARDYEQVRSGEKTMPTASGIVEQVYSRIIMPAVETAVAATLGIFGTPLLWIYRRTLGGAVRYLIGKIQTAGLDEEDEEAIEEGGAKLVEAVGQNAGKIELRLKTAASYTLAASDIVSRIILWPLRLGLVCLLLLALSPLAIFLYATW